MFETFSGMRQSYAHPKYLLGAKNKVVTVAAILSRLRTKYEARGNGKMIDLDALVAGLEMRLRNPAYNPKTLGEADKIPMGAWESTSGTHVLEHMSAALWSETLDSERRVSYEAQAALWSFQHRATLG